MNIEDYLKIPRADFIPTLVSDVKNNLGNMHLSTEAINMELNEFGDNSVELIQELNTLISLGIQNIIDILDAASEYNKLNTP